MIIDPKLVNYNIFLNGGEQFINFYTTCLLSERVVQNNTSFVLAEYSRIDGNNNPFNPVLNNGNSVVSQQWFYTTLPNGKKMANHSYTISTYSDTTFSRKIGEITFGANLLDHGENGIILEGEGFNEALNGQLFSVQSANGVYSNIHKVFLINFVLFGINLFQFVKYY